MTDSTEKNEAAGVAELLGASLAPLDAPAPLLPSTADENVDRARRRRDRLSPADIGEAAALVGRYLAAQSRAPFRALLAEMVGAKPTPEAIARFADKYPDRWAQAVSILAGLSGYERGVVEINVFNIKGLSDSELLRQLEETDRQVAALRHKKAGATDVEVLPVGPAP